ncbi:hypothetical protein J7E62_32900 [Variovorax paradoxus]|nr:hypothetical protein [Variovorax paradoxus]
MDNRYHRRELCCLPHRVRRLFCWAELKRFVVALSLVIWHPTTACGTCELRTRQGVDATKWYPELTAALTRAQGDPTTDGEVSVLNELRVSDFNALMARKRADLESGRASPIALRPARRRQQPERCLLRGHHTGAETRQIWARAVHQLKLEGLVAKRADSLYQPGFRSTA